MNFIPPTTQHLARMYLELGALGARAVGAKKSWPYRPADACELIVLAVEMSRYDARLFGIVVEYLHTHWGDLNPTRLRLLARCMPTLQALVTAFSFAVVADANEDRSACYRYLSDGVNPAEPQLFFKGLYLPGSTGMWRSATESVQEFLDWGFLARERPVIHENGARKIIGHWSAPARRRILERLIAQQASVNLSSYLDAVDGTICRQQALKDLRSCPGLKMAGKGRGSCWVQV